jgi:phenylalanyl-tRNA synthetase beta chain
MKAPIEWLKEFVALEGTPETLAEKLTMSGVEVSSIEYHGRGIKDVVTGRIISAEKHPKKPDILICVVDTGFDRLQIITKASNVKAGDVVPVALHGATLPSGIKIEKRELHGVESFGMLCSTVELGITESAEGIMILPPDTAIGEDIKKVLGIGGAVLEADVLPNRIDLLSVYGVAREFAAVLDKPLKQIKFKVKESSSNVSKEATVEIKDKDLCPRYMARVIKGIKIGPSPKWLEERLLACGMRPINNVVDVTNYVLQELGQPLHAFDLDLISGRSIIVRRAHKGEKMKTLDGETRELKDALVIADKEKAVAVAGVMGGASSEVIPSTKNILLESAYFEPTSVNRTEKALKLRTEASMRFDRGVDWDMLSVALDRAAALIAELGGGELCKGVIDVCPKKRSAKNFPLRLERVNRILGTDLKNNEVASILSRLGFTYKSGHVCVPLFRAGDIEREIDVIEEIARIHGYDKIPSTLPAINNENVSSLSEKQLNEITLYLMDAGLNETVTYSMRPAKEIYNIGENRGKVKLLNPITDDLSMMRTSLLPSLLNVLSYNANRQTEDIALFEINKTFYQGAKGIEEKLELGAVLYGKRVHRYDQVKDTMDLTQCKMMVEDILQIFGVTYELKNNDLNGFDPGKSACYKVEGNVVATFGALHPDISDAAGVKGAIYAFNMDLSALLGKVKLPQKYKAIPSFPSTKRDIAMTVPKTVTHQAIVDEIKAKGGHLVEDVILFDVYHGKQIEQGYYGMAYSVVYRSSAATLTDAEVNPVHEKVLSGLKEKLGIRIR